jgi:hypothetical protein
VAVCAIVGVFCNENILAFRSLLQRRKYECELAVDCESFSIIFGTFSTGLPHASCSTLAYTD